MTTLWAPWRMEYIKGVKSEGCFLCEDAADPGHDAEHLVLFRGATALVVLNRYPYNNGHLMIAPYRHVADLAGMTDEERLELMRLADRSVAVLKTVMAPDGFNLGVNLGRVAGAGLDSHLHLHVVPRWNGDTNFMPVLADTKVIPQALSDLHGSLRAAFSAG